MFDISLMQDLKRREMLEELLPPTIVSYSFAVDACEKAQRYDVAASLMEMVDELDLT